MFSADARLQSGASTLTECQTACEFDSRCVAADWVSTFRECWITTNPNYPHRQRPTGWHQSDSHYHLVSRCNVTAGQCFMRFSVVDNSCMYKVRWVKSSHNRWLTNMCYAGMRQSHPLQVLQQCCGRKTT